MSNEKNKEEWGRQLIWAAVKLYVLTSLLYLMTLLPKMFTLQGIFYVVYHMVTISLCVIVVAGVYKMFSKFFGKQDRSED